MTKMRSLMSRQASDAVDSTTTDPAQEIEEQDFLESASPDTKSEVSQYYDAHSEGKLSFVRLFITGQSRGVPHM